jgi:hypothetical protein
VTRVDGERREPVRFDGHAISARRNRWSDGTAVGWCRRRAGDAVRFDTSKEPMPGNARISHGLVVEIDDAEDEVHDIDW